MMQERYSFHLASYLPSQNFSVASTTLVPCVFQYALQALTYVLRNLNIYNLLSFLFEASIAERLSLITSFIEHLFRYYHENFFAPAPKMMQERVFYMTILSLYAFYIYFFLHLMYFYATIISNS